MENEKPRLARLIAILTQLQSKRMVTAKEIADKHNVSIRTVYRDIRTLEKSNIPIVTIEGKGYSVMEGYRLSPVMFTEEEANAIITAEQIISKNKDNSLVGQYANAVEKIKSVMLYGQQEKSELLTNRIQIRNNAENEKTSDFLMRLQSAITNFQVMRIAYVSLQENHSERKIEPFALYSTQGNWILVAFCQLKKDFRAFRLDRIQVLQATNDRFESHGITLQDYFDDCRKKYNDP